MVSSSKGSFLSLLFPMLSKFKTYCFASIVVATLIGVATPASAILQKGQPAPPFSVTSTSGQAISLANYRGYVLVLDFFATWCLPCRDIVSHLNELNARFGKQGLQILGMNVEEEDNSVKSFISERKVGYPVATAAEALQTEYGLRSVPTIFIVNKKGVVVEKYMGHSDEVKKSMEATIKRLLAE